MQLKSILLTATVAIAVQANAQTWTYDTVSVGANYLQNIYYSLDNGQVGTAPADDWDLGFSVSPYSASVIVNTANGLQLFEISTDVADFGTDMTSALTAAITANPMPLYNSNETWEQGAFNNGSSQGSFGYGWGDYDMNSHWILGSRVFGLITATDTFQVLIVDKETYQVTDAPVFNFKIAKIDGTNPITKSFALGATPYNDRNFGYYNITNDAFVNREPASTDWDFLFTSYNDEGVVYQNQQYKVFGIVNNEGLRVAMVDTPDNDFDNIAPLYANFTYDTVNNSIGRAWKTSGQSGTYVNDSLCYFIKTANDDVYQLVFTAHNSGLATTDPGLVALKKRIVSNTASVKNINNDVNMFEVYPNPATSDVNVLIDAKTAIGAAQLTITDITGKMVYRAEVKVNNGLNAYNIATSQFVNGNYIITLTNGSWKTTQKLVVQH